MVCKFQLEILINIVSFTLLKYLKIRTGEVGAGMSYILIGSKQSLKKIDSMTFDVDNSDFKMKNQKPYFVEKSLVVK